MACRMGRIYDRKYTVGYPKSYGCGNKADGTAARPQDGIAPGRAQGQLLIERSLSKVLLRYF